MQLSDRSLFLLNMAFVVIGVLMLSSKPDVGIVTIAFFGSGAVFAGSVILRKWRSAPKAERVMISGGVPIRPSRMLIGGLGAWLAALGVILTVFGWSYGIVFRGLSIASLIFGCYLLTAVLVGWLPSTYIQFDASGITFGHRGFSYVVAFDNIAGLAVAEMNRNPFLCIRLHQPDIVVVTPPEKHVDALKQIARSEALLGAHIAIPAQQYLMDATLLAQAIGRYVSEPAARSELSVRSLTPAA
ncbi:MULTISPECIES: hypothetical protein [unclassified Bradyrhizobium]|uniref:hypothetical protein n=1 Tax=unclassified Bradyrhizobium TaxID=2631580 RepID=UPI0028E89B5F|nr:MULTISPECIES: hypothetical protein [unclassified Bradyrhizobium]